MLEIARTNKEVDDLLNFLIDKIEEGGSFFKDLTFEEGIAYAIKWLTDPDEPNLFEDVFVEF